MISVDICGEVYERFIIEALKCSDMFSFDIYWLTDEELYDNIEMSKKYPTGSVERTLYENSVIPKIKSNLDIFKINGMDFIKSFEPFVIHKEKFRGEDTWFLKPDLEVIPLLLQPKSILNWRVPYFVDNISFAKEGRYWFFTTTHEYDINFSLESLEEV